MLLSKKNTIRKKQMNNSNITKLNVDNKKAIFKIKTI